MAEKTTIDLQVIYEYVKGLFIDDKGKTNLNVMVQQIVERFIYSNEEMKLGDMFCDVGEPIPEGNLQKFYDEVKRDIE